MSSLPTYEIRERRPFRCLLWMILLAMLIIVGQWHYHHHISPQQAKLVSEKQRLSNELLALQASYELLSQTQNSQQQLQTMHEATTTQLESRLQQLQQKVIELNKELLFYQSVTQGTGSSELQVRELQLRPDNDEPSLLRYRLVLTQGDNISEPITGEVIVSLLADAEATEDPEIIGEHGLNLRFVQVIEGSFSLPTDLPAILSVTLTQKDKTLTKRDFNWQEIMPTAP